MAVALAECVAFASPSSAEATLLAEEVAAFMRHRGVVAPLPGGAGFEHVPVTLMPRPVRAGVPPTCGAALVLCVFTRAHARLGRSSREARLSRASPSREFTMRLWMPCRETRSSFCVRWAGVRVAAQHCRAGRRHTLLAGDSVAGHDTFTGALLDLYKRILAVGVRQPLQLGVIRSDYFVDQSSGDLKQVSRGRRGRGCGVALIHLIGLDLACVGIWVVVV